MCQRGDLRPRRPSLERAGLLEVLGLDVEPAVGELNARDGLDDGRRRRRAEHRGPVDLSLERFTGRGDLLEGHDSVGHRRSMQPDMRWSRHLRVCASSATIVPMLEQLESSDDERQRYAAVGRALADPKRLCVLESLAVGELSVRDLATRVSCQVPNMSQHLAVLRSAGLVTTPREGSTVFYRLADPRVLEAYRLIQTIAG